MKKISVIAFILMILPLFVFAENKAGTQTKAAGSKNEIVVKIQLVNENGVAKEIGTITASDTKYGLLLQPNLTDLPPGVHGFHVHEHPTCDAAKKDDKMTPAHAAGSHFDPHKSAKHLGPYDADGHLGDLPALYVGSDGKSTTAVLAPRLKTSSIQKHALMIHAGGDNYSDKPEPLGGGGARIACGVVQ